jgi:hypothetical protein
MGEMRYVYKIPVENPEGKIQLRIIRRTWVDNIRMDLREIISEDTNWIHLAQERDKWRSLVNTIMKFLFP